jgi:toxin YoeB
VSSRDRQVWTPQAWGDHLYWPGQDRQSAKRIDALMRDIQRGDPFEGLGKHEPLKHLLTGVCSRRIDKEHRLVYLVDDTSVTLLQARFHY